MTDISLKNLERGPDNIEQVMGAKKWIVLQ